MAIYKLEEIAIKCYHFKKTRLWKDEYVLNTSDVFLNKYNPKVVNRKNLKNIKNS